MERDFIDKPKRHVNQTMWELDSNPDSTNSIKKKKVNYEACGNLYIEWIFVIRESLSVFLEVIMALQLCFLKRVFIFRQTKIWQMKWVDVWNWLKKYGGGVGERTEDVKQDLSW